MRRPITGFGIDDQGDWFATLSCGHRQHVRHRPPFINRPWVMTEAGRSSRLGHPLDCVRCDRLEFPDGCVLVRATPECSEADIAQLLDASHVADDRTWVRIVVTSGGIRYRIPALDIDMRLRPDVPGIVPPRIPHRLDAAGPATLYLEMHRVVS